jgi:Arc/MetJ-type ribon-helix-helix transcriptional regulator
MKSLSIDLPDNLATAVESYVKAGFFRSELDLFLAAISTSKKQAKDPEKAGKLQELIWKLEGSDKRAAYDAALQLALQGNEAAVVLTLSSGRIIEHTLIEYGAYCSKDEATHESKENSCEISRLT